MKGQIVNRLNEIIKRQREAFARWQKFAYKGGADPKGEALQKLVNDFKVSYAKHLSDQTNADELLITLAYILSGQMAPNMLKLDERQVADITTGWGDVFGLTVFEAVNVFRQTVKPEGAKNNQKIVVIPKN